MRPVPGRGIDRRRPMALRGPSRGISLFPWAREGAGSRQDAPPIRRRVKLRYIRDALRGRASLIPLRCPLAHRRGIAIPGPFGSANRAASSKPARFFRRWRRFAAFLFPTATASLGCGGGPRFLEKENAPRPVEEKIAFAAQPALRASWRKCGGLPNQYRLSIEVSYRVRSTLAVVGTAPPQLAEPRRASWGGRPQGLSSLPRAFRFAMRCPGSPGRRVPSPQQPPDCVSKRGAGSIRERPQLVKLPYVDEWTKPTGQHPQTPRNRREKAFQAEPEMPPPKRFSLPPGATHSLFQEKREWGAQSRRASPAPPPRPGTGRISAPAGDSDRTIQTEG